MIPKLFSSSCTIPSWWHLALRHRRGIILYSNIQTIHRTSSWTHEPVSWAELGDCHGQLCNPQTSRHPGIDQEQVSRISTITSRTRTDLYTEESAVNFCHHILPISTQSNSLSLQWSITFAGMVIMSGWWWLRCRTMKYTPGSSEHCMLSPPRMHSVGIVIVATSNCHIRSKYHLFLHPSARAQVHNHTNRITLQNE